MMDTNWTLGYLQTDYTWGNIPVLQVAIFVVLWIASNGLADGLKSLDSPARGAVVEAIKLLISIGCYIFTRHDTIALRSHGNGSLDDGRDVEYHPLVANEVVDANEECGDEYVDVSAPASSRVRSTVVFVVVTASLHAIQSHFAPIIRRYEDPLSWFLVQPITTLCSLFLLKLCLSRSFASVQYYAAALLFCGLYIVRTTCVPPLPSNVLDPHILGLAILSSLTAVMTDFTYKAHTSIPFHAVNIAIFSSSLIVHLLDLVSQSAPYSIPFSSNIFSEVSLPVLQACRDIASLFIISRLDAAAEGVMACFSLVLLLLGFGATSPLSMFGVSIALVTSCHYFWIQHQDNSDSLAKAENVQTPFRIVGIVVFIALSALVGVVALHDPYNPFRKDDVSSNKFISTKDIFAAAKRPPKCVRKPLPPSTLRSHSVDYHTFDNVLLIVFFSHPRYDVNLDYYHDVYSDYFPNILFIGPRSREDKGFSHSYDVLVDSYEVDEDLDDPSFYQIAGRMGHHMLYTALKEYDCYDGYLWAPFDAFLNVPRLQQFDQDRFWYHSPWGEFVHNPAAEASQHAPPAKMSPDPAQNLSESWRWETDWWWGSPHVGLTVCMEAFKKVPLSMRERLASLTDHQTRFIGGSTDTLYIPHRHRRNFMDVLSLFLETSCFFEIATPTTVHLVLPPDEQVLFLDHWWIWTPPFNSTFVRQKWEEGLEVDTFHAFHWGERGEDGIWRGNPDNIADVRLLLEDSARRQKIAFP